MVGSETLLTVTAPDRGWESWGCAPDQLPEALSAGPPIAGPLCHLLPTPRFQDSHMGWEHPEHLARRVRRACTPTV